MRNFMIQTPRRHSLTHAHRIETPFTNLAGAPDPHSTEQDASWQRAAQ